MSLTNLTDDLAAQIKKRRDERNLTQSEAAAELGVSERTLQNWESGATFPWARHRRALEIFLSPESNEPSGSHEEASLGSSTQGV